MRASAYRATCDVLLGLLLLSLTACASWHPLREYDITACGPGRRMVLLVDHKGRVVDVQCVGWVIPPVRKETNPTFIEARK